MYLLFDKRPRILLFLSILLPLLLIAGGNSGASNRQQAPASLSAFQPAKPIFLTDPVPDPKQPGVVWFAPTGHTLRGTFLDYWNKNGGLAQFGYPLTEEFFEEIGPEQKQYRVQYFERNRFEYHPENIGTPSEVLLGMLGRDFHAVDPPVAPVAGAEFFPQTGHNLSGKFKEYWDTHLGLFVHGYPITEPIQEKSRTDGKTYTVQYFERSRFELHPENAGTPYEVLLGLLGWQLSEKKGYRVGWYPLYGYGGDYSWFAGFYRQDPRKCAPCGCKTVNFVRPRNPTYPEDTPAVLPYGDDWPNMMKEKGINATLTPETFIVVFGQPDDPNSVSASIATSISTGEAINSCLSPMFKVTGLEYNPIH